MTSCTCRQPRVTIPSPTCAFVIDCPRPAHVGQWLPSLVRAVRHGVPGCGHLLSRDPLTRLVTVTDDSTDRVLGHPPPVDSVHADETATRPPCGWYADPGGGNYWRWWDGEQWTGHISSASEFTETDLREDGIQKIQGSLDRQPTTQIASQPPQQFAWRIKSGRGPRSHEYELVDEAGHSRSIATVSGFGLLKEISVGERDLTVKRRPLAGGYDVLDAISNVPVAEANWRRMTIRINDGPQLVGAFSKAAAPWWGWQASWSTDRRLAITLNWMGNPFSSFSSWPLMRISVHGGWLGDDAYLAACLVAAHRAPSSGIQG